MYHSGLLSSRERGEVINNHEYEILARQIALSAMNLGIAETRRDFAAAPTIARNNVPFRDGLFDLTGSVQPGGLVGLHAVSYINESQYHICSTLSPGSGGPIESSLVIDAEEASVSFAGNSFNVLGLDVMPPSVGGLSQTRGGPLLSGDRGVHAAGVSAATVETVFEDAASSAQEDNILGQEGNLDVFYGPMALDIDALYSEAREEVVTTLSGGTHSGTATYGSADAPTIVHITGDANITGNWNGFGVLLIDGDMSISAGDFMWEGIVIASAPAGKALDVNLTGGMEIYGSLILRASDPVEASGDPGRGHHGPTAGAGSVDFRQSGNAAVMYSAETIDRLASMISVLGGIAPSKIYVANRREGKTGC
jgi:hypothetical protein